MRKTTVGAIAVVAASSVLSVVGLGLANASPMESAAPATVAAASTAQSEAATLQGLHDQLQSSFKASQVAGMKSSTQQMITELLLVRGTATKAGMASDTTSLVARAQQFAGQLVQKLNEVTTDALPLGGGLLDSVTSLVSSLLTTVLSLISSLLGGLPALPVPLPVGAPAA
ncbi:MAG TPA: hypothetical protein VHW44_06720 [Pseudonocardiaceae bacterium]|jgi:hypothetical protein|nr:hypothetical protein [Pseudonocardiaceae bacterium]